MTITWGDDLLDTTQGLDVLGVRGIDQAVELALVNGLTTISQRGRFLSILPWALGDFLTTHTSSGFNWEQLIVYLRRVEFVTLAATRLDNEVNGADASGARLVHGRRFQPFPLRSVSAAIRGGNRPVSNLGGHKDRRRVVSGYRPESDLSDL